MLIQRTFCANSRKRAICSSVAASPPLPAPSLSPSVQSPGLLWVVYSYFRFVQKEGEGGRAAWGGGTERGKHGVASGEHGGIQASWLWVCEVILLPTNSSLISQFQQIRIRWLHNSHRVDNCILCNHHLKHLEQGSPTSGPQTGPSRQISSSVRLEIKDTRNVMCLNHPETIPPPIPTPIHWKCISWSWSLVPKNLRTADLEE